MAKPGGGAISTGDKVILATMDGYGFRVTGPQSGAVVDADASTQADSTLFTVEFVRASNGGTIGGTVTDAATGAPIAGAIGSLEGPGMFTGISGSNGGFILANSSGNTCVRAGMISLGASALGYHPSKTPVTVAACGTASVAIPLEKCGGLRVIVIAANNSRIPGATVFFAGGSATADASGQVQIPSVCKEGEMEVSATAPCFLPGVATGVVPRTGSASVDIHLQPDPQCPPTKFVCDRNWEVRKGMFTNLGKAQDVCLDANNPPGCPTSSTKYGYSDAGWAAGTAWIWAPTLDGTTAIKGTTKPAYPAEFFFTHQFSLPLTPRTAKMSVAADDFAEVWVNEEKLGTIGSVTDGAAAGPASTSITTFPNFLSKLKLGLNNITIRAANGNFGCGNGEYSCNPAGLLCGVEIGFN
jgi:hypothetical protein